jgi:hypothetical protein
MKLARLAILILTASLLPGCGAETILENAPAISALHDCGEPTTLFKNFQVWAKKISWSRPRGTDRASILTLDLVFENTANWPLALSNSGNGIVFSVAYSLLDNNGTIHTPKNAEGIVSKTVPKKKSSEAKNFAEPEKPLLNVYSQIKQHDSAEGRLVFEAPRGNYLLTIERRFAGASVPGNRADHVSVCKIPSRDFVSAKSATFSGPLGVY